MPNSADFNRFSVNPVNIDMSRSMFNMDHSVKFSCNVGDVVPFDCIEVLPGDTFEIDTSKVVRLQPLVTPIMDEVIMDVYWFFIPNRLVWNHWQNFLGENDDSPWAPRTEYTIPQLYSPAGGFEKDTIADYLGVPTYVEGANVSALPFRAYALVCDQWFRSEAVMDPVNVWTDDQLRRGSNGSDQVEDIQKGGKPFIACKFFDYFTSALPSPQRGESVKLPIINSGSEVNIPVRSRGWNSSTLDHPYTNGKTSQDPPVHMTWADANADPSTGRHQHFSLTDNFYLGHSTQGQLIDESKAMTSPALPGIFFDNLWVSLNGDNFNSVTINDLRTAFAIQKYLEKQARYGGRYIEYIKAFFSVDSPDARLQRTEYLGGSRLSLNINSVEATSSQGQPIGTVAGMSVTADSNSDFTKSFTEHGHILGCAVLRYHHSYQQGLHRMWRRKNEYDFYNPVFANLGEQAIQTSELYYNDTVGNPDRVFGYQERWAEYRYLPNRCAGEFRSSSPTPLDMWHLGDYYNDRPTLSPEWLREDKSMLDRCLAVTSSQADQCLCDFFIQTKAIRVMPLYSIPGLIDHH